MLGLRCYTQAFSGHGEQGLLFSCSGFLLWNTCSRACGPQELQLEGSRVQAQ